MKDTDSIKPGKMVKFSQGILEFYNDFEVFLVESEDIMSYTFLVLEVFEENLEAEVLTHEGNVLRLGFHDLEVVDSNEN
tara:strand:- start:828 stop:1064 length:237 start_codon:yes stop_codon:yes gene_type:complete